MAVKELITENDKLQCLKAESTRLSSLIPAAQQHHDYEQLEDLSQNLARVANATREQFNKRQNALEKFSRLYPAVTMTESVAREMLSMIYCEFVCVCL